MNELTVENVSVKLSPGLKLTPEIRPLVAEYIRNRFLTSVIAWNDSGAKKRAMRFASPAEADRLKNCEDFLTVEVGGFTGRIYTLFGLTPSQLTDEDIAFARALWFEPVYVERSEDGRLYIDD